MPKELNKDLAHFSYRILKVFHEDGSSAIVDALYTGQIMAGAKNILVTLLRWMVSKTTARGFDQFHHDLPGISSGIPTMGCRLGN